MSGKTLALAALLVAAVLAWIATRPAQPAREVLEAPARDRVEGSAATEPASTLPVPRPAPAEAATPEDLASPARAEAASEREPARPRSSFVTIYQHAAHDANFPGDTWKVTLGLSDAGRTFADDDASALDVPEGLSVTLYADKGGAGARLTLGPGRHNLAPHGFNDRVSSMRVEPFVPEAIPALELYRDVPPDGVATPGDWRLVLQPERAAQLFTVSNGDFEAGVISALRVPPGHEALVFEQPDGHGAAFVLGPGYHELGPVGLDDRAGSIRFARSTKY